jgi:2-oxoglutarate ferredoxin oxidoreductase subunit alpha
VQECVDLTREAFDLAERYRSPVLVMTDGEVGHMRERIVLPGPDEVAIAERRPPRVAPDRYVPFQAVRGRLPEPADFGTGYHTYVTGLTHDERGLPATDDWEAHTRLVRRLCAKIADDAEELTRVVVDVQPGATVGVVSYGISARSAAGAVAKLRSEGIRVSHLRLVTVFPFPEAALRDFAAGLERLVVPELNLGQICHCVREAVEGGARVEKVSKIGGEIIHPREIVAAVLDGGEPMSAAAGG